MLPPSDFTLYANLWSRWTCSLLMIRWFSHKGHLPTVEIIMQAFSHFSKVIGLTANKEKLQAFKRGVPKDTKQQILQLTGFSLGTFLVKYREVPFSPKSYSTAYFHMIIKKITKKIHCWQRRNLSYAGRAQLINSALFSLHSYWSSLFIHPKGVIKGIEDLCRNFLWG